jgi:hypothetical protein
MKRAGRHLPGDGLSLLLPTGRAARAVDIFLFDTRQV